MPESPEQIDFDPDHDLTADQKTALFETLERDEQMRDWPYYARYYIWLKGLWPDRPEQAPAEMSVAELQKKITNSVASNRLDIAAHYAADIQSLGVQSELFLDTALPAEILCGFDQNCNRKNLDTTLPQDALAIVRLGWRLTETVFRDRSEVWRKSQILLESYRALDDLYIFSYLLLQLRLLFPEHTSDLKLDPKELKKMKQQLRAIPPAATLKIGEYAFALNALTADSVTLGANGEYHIERQNRVSPASSLPERNLAV